MQILLVSLGSIGRRHLANLRELEPAATITILRRAIDPALSETQITTLDPALPFDAALLCSPASEHLAIARELAERGIPLFIEKPISHTLDGVADLIALARERRAPLMVGYNLRFFEPLRILRQALIAGRIGRLLSIRAEVGQYLPDWRPAADYRTGVTAQRALGGGALLELSHEIDYVRWLAGEVASVTAQVGRVGDLEIDAEDCAEIALRFRSGAIGSIHLDLLQRAPHRVCRAIGTEGTLTLDFIEPRVRLFTTATNAWSDLPAGPVDRNAMYLAELRHFLDCARTRSEPAITGEDGLRALEIVEAARSSSEHGCAVTSQTKTPSF